MSVPISVILGACFYVFYVISGSVKINGVEIENPFLRLILGPVVFAVVATILAIVGAILGLMAYFIAAPILYLCGIHLPF